MPFTDPQGFDVAITVSAVTTNQLTANCNSCTVAQRRRAAKGRPRPHDPPCACRPPAMVAPRGPEGPGNEAAAFGAAVGLLPDVAGGRGRDGRVFRLYYTATSRGTGLSCSGVAKVCAGGRSYSRRQNPGGGHILEPPGGRGAQRAAARAAAASAAASAAAAQAKLLAGSNATAAAAAAAAAAKMAEAAAEARAAAGAAAARAPCVDAFDARGAPLGMRCPARRSRLVCAEDGVEYNSLEVRGDEGRSGGKAAAAGGKGEGSRYIDMHAAANHLPRSRTLFLPTSSLTCPSRTRPSTHKRRRPASRPAAAARTSATALLPPPPPER